MTPKNTKGKNGYFHAEGKKRTGKGFPTKLSKEKPSGEWNEMEIQVHGSEKAVFILNGEVVHEITHFIQNDNEGNEIPLLKGRIGLQAAQSLLCPPGLGSSAFRLQIRQHAPRLRHRENFQEKMEMVRHQATAPSEAL